MLIGIGIGMQLLIPTKDQQKYGNPQSRYHLSAPGQQHA